MSEHTPTPWHIKAFSCEIMHGWDIKAEDRSQIAEIETSCATADVNLANAEFIVRAANAHGSLVAALEGFISLGDLLFNVAENPAHFVSLYREALEDARSAVAKAKAPTTPGA